LRRTTLLSWSRSVSHLPALAIPGPGTETHCLTIRRTPSSITRRPKQAWIRTLDRLTFNNLILISSAGSAPTSLFKLRMSGVCHTLSMMPASFNAAVYGPGATLDNAQSRRPIFTQYYGSIPGLFSDVNGNYHSLQVEVQKRFSSSYTLQAAYTWNKSIDNGSNTLIGGGGAQDPNNWGKPERAVSDFNVPQVLSVNGLWDLPALKGKGILTSIVGGWRLSGIFRYSSGMPSTVFSGADNALIGYSRPNGGRERANVNGNPTLSVSRSRQNLEAEYFNTAAFSAPAAGQFGTVGRNTIIGPGRLSSDFAVMKAFPLPAEIGQFEFRAEFFNLINWTNLGQRVQH